MRIGIDYIATIGGGGNSVYSKNLIDGIINVDRQNDYYLYVYLHDFLRGRYSSRKQKNIHWRPVYFSSLGLKIPHRLVTWVNACAIRLFAKLDRLDLFHFTNPMHFVRGIKNSLVTIHDLSSFYNKGWTKEGSRQFFSKIMNELLSNSVKIIAVSEYTKRDIIDKFKTPGNKIKVIYEAADTAQYYPDSDPHNLKAIFNLTSYILYAGQLQPRKNILNMIEAYANLDTGLKENFPLVLVGISRDQDYEHMIKEKIVRLKLDQDVILLGRVEDNALRKLYSGAKFFMFPSLFEGFGLPILESLQCGRPVIASNTTSLPEVAGKAGILVDPQNIPEITQAMKKMLTNEVFYDNIRGHTLSQAEKFSWGKAVHKTIKIYQSIQ